MLKPYAIITQVVLTDALHALVYEAVEQRAAVVAERGAGVCVYFELVFALQVLTGSAGEEWRVSHREGKVQGQIVKEVLAEKIRARVEIEGNESGDWRKY